MKSKSGFALVLGLLMGWMGYAQTEVNYQHKTLVKELQKSGITDLARLEELKVADSVVSSGTIQGKYFLITETNAHDFKYIYVGRVNSCRAGGCSISGDATAPGASEYFDYFMLFDTHKKVQLVRVFNYQATHGHEITAKGWLKQFIGHDSSGSLQVDKNIDAISGATISVHAITNDIEAKTALLKRMGNQESLRASK